MRGICLLSGHKSSEQRFCFLENSLGEGLRAMLRERVKAHPNRWQNSR